MRGTEGGLHDSTLPLVIIDVDHSESGSEEHSEQVYGVLLAGERVGIHVNMLHRLGIRNHEVLCLRNLVINDGRSQLNVMYSEEAVNFEGLAVFLLPSNEGFSGLLEVDFREVAEESVAPPRTRDV